MTRIIAGIAGSLTLEVPGAGTRPTSDRVRESLFAALDAADLLRDAAVLDLYAGSGALGLEAASRGAASVHLVERAPAAARIARRNATKVAKALGTTALGTDATLHVHATAVRAYLHGVPGPFDLVLVDPPYDLSEVELTAVLDALAPALSPDATVIVERASRSPRPELPAGLEHVRDRRYGDTTMWWARPGDQPVAASQSR
ncbi:MAG: 16S rRNA (guanine(966)-N(2))-methyltransferase RsmD [Microbacterium sp.]|uniref:16S rRNA (guanine(966)-N(2))-methyltransferase RsmD n=1 Tax=Microbacterium sp. TaxID=51671 RepID=UPI003A867AFD